VIKYKEEEFHHMRRYKLFKKDPMSWNYFGFRQGRLRKTNSKLSW
jgi:hypothetical protein